MDDVESVGLVGVGSIGERLAGYLVEAGYSLTAYDVDPERLRAAEECGAAPGEHPAAVTAASDVVVLSLPGSGYVEVVMEGEDGVLDALEAGQLVVDTGTTRPDVEVRYERACADRGAGYVDAPLTLGGPGDKPIVFVGGDEEWYERGREVIEALSHDHRRLGGIGAGQVAKAGHRLRQNGRGMVDAEVAEFWRNNGVDPAELDDLLGLGLHAQLFAEEYPSVAGWERALRESSGGGPDDGEPKREHYESDDDAGVRLDETGARPRLRQSAWTKDQAYAIDVGHASNTALPIARAVYGALLASENYAEALFDRELAFADDDWFDRADPVAHYRRLNRPAEEWRRVNAQREE